MEYYSMQAVCRVAPRCHSNWALTACAAAFYTRADQQESIAQKSITVPLPATWLRSPLKEQILYESLQCVGRRFLRQHESQHRDGAASTARHHFALLRADSKNVSDDAEVLLPR